MNSLMKTFVWVILAGQLPFSTHGQDSPLPHVFEGEPADYPAMQLRLDAAKAAQRQQLPRTAADWKVHASRLKSRIAEDLALSYQPDLPLDIRETGTVQGDGFTVRNISFQTQPGVLATANLYVPSGNGPFPAVVITHGHWPDGRRAPLFQAVAQTLVRSGYVCLNIDAWGAGERGTLPGQQEYHGANLGASLMNVGHTLIGLQLADNMRGIDLLASLPYVDSTRIGATGASGGGNQTMWLAAMDDRVKAAMPVVSVGTFQSYIMNSNCICELLPTGLTYTEEAGILALVAPRALKIISAVEEKNPSFMPQQMLISYRQVKSLYRMLGAADHIAYHIAAGGHDYSAEMREHLLGWFDLYLKGEGTGAPKETPAVVPIEVSLLATYPEGKRDDAVATTERFCQQEGQRLKAGEADAQLPRLAVLREALRQLLHFRPLTATRVTDYSPKEEWQRMAVETDAGGIIPVLYTRPKEGNRYTLLLHGSGKDSIPPMRIQQLLDEGYGVMVADLWGTGEQGSDEAQRVDGALPPFHTLARSALWLGKPIMATWAAETQLLLQLCIDQLGATDVHIEAYRDAALAASYALALSEVPRVEFRLTDFPSSYLFDSREGIEYYSMAVHVPRILQWGDVPLLLAMSGTKLILDGAKTLSGRPLNRSECLNYQQEIENIAVRIGGPPITVQFTDITQ